MSKFFDPFLTWYFDLPMNGEEGGIQRLWRLEAAWNWQTAQVLALAVCLLGIGLWLASSMSRKRSRLARLFLLSNRLLVIFLVSLLLLQVRLKTVAYGRPKLTLLIDTSRSMSLQDQYASEDLKNLQSAEISSTSKPRIDLLKDVLTNGSASWINRVAGQYELELLTFDSQLHIDQKGPVSTGVPGDALLDPAQEKISNLKATGTETNFLHSLDELSRIQRDRPSVAIVLFSDGNPTTHSSAALSRTEKAFKRLRTPVHSVGVGSRRSTRDLAITEADFEPVGFAGEDHPMTVSLVANQEIKLPVTIRVRNVPQDSEVFSVTIEGLLKDVSESVPMVLPDLTPGRNDFEVEVTPLSGETDLKNNIRRIRVWGRESDLNVLLVDRLPRWEYRHLKSTLERDPHLAVQTFLSESDPAFAIEDRTALNRLPKSLESIDAVILGGMNFETLDSQFIEELQRFVREQGGGLLLLSSKISLGSLDRDSMLAEMHPAIVPASDSVERRPARISMTSEGKAQGMLPVGIDQAQLDLLPEIYPRFNQYATKPSAIPFLQGMHSEQRGEPLPLSLSMRYGEGVVVQHLFDETWRWRPVEGGEFYRKFWSQMIRNLCRRELLDQLPPLELLTDQDEYRSYESVQVRLLDRKSRFLNQEFLTIRLEPVDANSQDRQPPQTIVMKRSHRALDGYAATLENLPPGQYSISLSSKVESEEAASTVQSGFRVLDTDPEEDYLPMNENLLRSLSKSTKGTFSNLWEMNAIIDQLPKRTLTGDSETRLIPLWNRWEILLVFIATMTFEWIFRRRTGVD